MKSIVEKIDKKNQLSYLLCKRLINKINNNK